MAGVLSAMDVVAERGMMLAAHCRRRAEAAGSASSVVTPLRWPERSRSAGEALDAERRRRREAAVPVTPKPPPGLGASFRERNVFVLPEDDEEPQG